MVARRVSYSTLPLWRPLSLGPLAHSPFAGVSSRALFVSAHFVRHVLALPLTHASSSGARLQPQSIVSRSSTQASRFCSRGALTFCFPFSSSVVHDRLMHLSCPLYRRSCSLIPWCFGTPNLPTHRCGAALDVTLSTPSLPSCVTVHSGSNCCSLAPLCCLLLSSDHMLCPCHLHASLPTSAHSSLPRVRDWSSVAAACHHSLSVWHQSWLTSLAHSLTFLRRASTLFDSLTRILFDCASLHLVVARIPPRTRQPLWWNDACYHALVARNGSWRDFRRSGSHEDQARFRLLRQQFHSIVRSSRTPLLERVAWFCDVPLPPCSQACLLSRPPHLGKSWHGQTWPKLVLAKLGIGQTWFDQTWFWPNLDLAEVGVGHRWFGPTWQNTMAKLRLAEVGNARCIRSSCRKFRRCLLFRGSVGGTGAETTLRMPWKAVLKAS